MKDRVVLDVGANICDSSIFFVLNGAAHAYAIEVMPSTAEICRENVEINGLTDKVTALNIGLGRLEKVKIPKNLIASSEFQIYGSSADNIGSDYIYMNVKSLDQVVDELSVRSAVMKIDCEGCEYEVFNYVSPDAIPRFTHIIGEYHYGPLPLKAKA